MDTYLVCGHNGWIKPMSKGEDHEIKVKAKNAEAAVRRWLKTHNFKSIGPVGIRVHTVKNITNPRIVNGLYLDVHEREIKNIIKCIKPVNGAPGLVSTGEIIA